MCTVNWLHRPDGYHLLCNRDEKRTRGIAVGPRAALRDGVQYLAPIDSDARGTWLAINEYGLSLCLLNGAAPAQTPERSRGLLIPGLIHARDLDHAANRIQAADLHGYAPFTLLALQAQRTAWIANWDGERAGFLPNGEPQCPLTSSSVDPEGARRARPASTAPTPRRSASVGSSSPATRCASFTRTPRPASGAPANRSRFPGLPDHAPASACTLHLCQ